MPNSGTSPPLQRKSLWYKTIAHFFEIQFSKFYLNLDVDCQVGQWSEWSSCSVECGGGTQGRWRDVIESPVSNGQSCPKLEENQACNQQPCGKYFLNFSLNFFASLPFVLLRCPV